ncbi:ephrin type-A receptor 3-like [Sycon ciliatum]|uniref:ephrin type-A receptor 3-like n=1 Tax=Sycon ciliatum TaxID=27933 RepID=UPI0031F71069
MVSLGLTDYIVLAIGVVVLLFAIATVILIIYCGYCKEVCGGCCSSNDEETARPMTRPQSHRAGMPRGYNMKARSSLTPLAANDALEQFSSGQLERLRRDDIFLPAGIDTRPAPPGQDEPEPIEPMEDEFEDKAMDMGLVFVPGQALSDLPDGGYSFPDDEIIQNDEEAPPLQPRMSGNWNIVKQSMLPRTKQIVMEEEEVSGCDADHDELYYASARNCFRYIAPKRVSTLEEIGHGEFGSVFRGVWQSSTHGEVTVALKTLKEDSSNSALGEKKLLAEGLTLGGFHHQNVLTLYGVVVYDRNISLVTELLSGGSLLNHLSRLRPVAGDEMDPKLPEKLLTVAQDVARGMVYLAEKNFVHRDLAARNILLSENSTAKIGDFGLSKLLSDDDYYVSHGGKLPYKWCPPEVINYRKFSLASDIWSYGVVLHEIWSFGRKPYFPMDNETVLKKVCGGYRMHPPPGCSRHLYTLMSDCWHPDRRKRPTALQAYDMLIKNTDRLLQLDSAARRRLNGVPTDAYQLGAGIETSKELYQDITAKYSHFNHDIGGMD